MTLARTVILRVTGDGGTRVLEVLNEMTMLRAYILSLMVIGMGLLIVLSPPSKAQFNREEKAAIDKLMESRITVARQDERLAANTAAIAATQAELQRLQIVLDQQREQIWLLRGIGIAFGSIVSALHLLLIYLHLRAAQRAPK